MATQDVLHILHTRDEIESVVGRLATAIARDYRDKNPLVIGILKGSFVFIADLIRRLDFTLEVDFIRLSSYGQGRETSGNVYQAHGLRTQVGGRHVLIAEDIIDTGITVAWLVDYFQKENPASLKLCALLDKPSRRRVPVKIDYLGLTVPDKFIVGYGIDCDERHRNLPDIYWIEDDTACRTET